KTRLLEFGPFAMDNRKRRGEGKPETFNFLGFTHICVKKRSNGMALNCGFFRSHLYSVRSISAMRFRVKIPHSGRLSFVALGGGLVLTAMVFRWFFVASNAASRFSTLHSPCLCFFVIHALKMPAFLGEAE